MIRNGYYYPVEMYEHLTHIDKNTGSIAGSAIIGCCFGNRTAGKTVGHAIKLIDLFNESGYTAALLVRTKDDMKNGYLEKWARQGVLMLNTVLTVRAHQANSHQGRGWEKFTDAIIEAVNAQDRPIVYLLWGSPAQRKIPMLTNPKHLILKAPHPSPLSAYRGFFGCRHFSQTNDFLVSHGLTPIDWQIENI